MRMTLTVTASSTRTQDDRCEKCRETARYKDTTVSNANVALIFVHVVVDVVLCRYRRRHRRCCRRCRRVASRRRNREEDTCARGWFTWKMSSDHGGFRLFNARDKKTENRAVIVILIVASRATIEGTISRVVLVGFSDTEKFPRWNPVDVSRVVHCVRRSLEHFPSSRCCLPRDTIPSMFFDCNHGILFSCALSHNWKLWPIAPFFCESTYVYSHVWFDLSN